jgi:hypothetical protein
VLQIHIDLPGFQALSYQNAIKPIHTLPFAIGGYEPHNIKLAFPV